MPSRLFHTVVVCGAAFAALPLACAAEGGLDDPTLAGSGELPSVDGGSGGEGERCRTPEGTCNEHCAPIADGGCLDPCFVHTKECSPDCLRRDGTCGWPPTK
jgi:hypothetical protein